MESKFVHQLLIFITLTLVALPGWAQIGVEDDDKTIYASVVFISQEYARGAHFIYDCDMGHFACVDEISFKNCGLDREIALRNKKFNLSCAPLKKFENRQKCEQAHYTHMHKLSLKYFCINELNILILEE